MDGTQPVLSEVEGIKANASKHKAMSWEYAGKLEEQLRSEVEELIRRAESESGQGKQEIDLPAELQRREARLNKITEVKAELQRRAGTSRLCSQAKRTGRERTKTRSKAGRQSVKSTRTWSTGQGPSQLY